MSNTYTQLHIHCVFAVKYRAALIHPFWEERLHKYITGIVTNNRHKLIAINSVKDHLHMFMGLNPNQSLSEIMRLVKGDSAEFINKENITKNKFRWQDGYGAFSHSHSQIDQVVKYIQNQKEHHSTKTFLTEYKNLLIDFGINYNENYIFSELID